MALYGPNLAISEFSRHIHYDFLKEEHKGSFHTKNYENLQRHLEDRGKKHSKMAILAKKRTIFTIFWAFWGSKNFSTEKIFGGHLSHMETQLHAKNKKKNIERSRLKDRNARTHERTDGRE